MAEHELPEVDLYAQDSYWLQFNQQEVGVVYFLGAFEFYGDQKLQIIKIGYTRHLSQRLNSLRSTMGPYRGELMATAPGGAGRERHYHKIFAEHRFSGEWFEPAPEILAEIERLSV